MGVSDSTLEAAKNRYVNIHAWDLTKELSDQIKKSGDSEFDNRLGRETGTHSYDAPPHLEGILNLLSTQKLSAYDEVKLSILKNFYKKHRI